MALAEWPSGLVELSTMLGVAPQRVYALAADRLHRYVDIEVSKRGGGVRKISIPVSELKGLQRLLLRGLWGRFPTSEIAHGYKHGRSIISAAQEHVGPTCVLRMDLRDFFPSITAKRVFGYLRKRGLSEASSFIITRLVTHQGKLPQGAPTSPGLSNAICCGMDEELARVSRSRRLAVTRYSDDIIFSGAPFNWKSFAKVVARVTRRHGFSVNVQKTRYMSRNQSQRVLGMLVDSSSIRMTRGMRRRIRAAFFKAGNQSSWGVQNLARLRGYAEFHKMVYGADEQYRAFRSLLNTIKQIRTHELPAASSI